MTCCTHGGDRARPGRRHAVAVAGRRHMHPPPVHALPARLRSAQNRSSAVKGREYFGWPARWRGVPVLLLLLVAMVVEISVLVVVGQAIGLLPTILLLIAASVIGMWLLRREGARTFAAFQEALRTRRVPHREMADGILIAAAGALILI